MRRTYALLAASPGNFVHLLSVRGLGRFTGVCWQDRSVSIEFLADHLLPTSDLVVSVADVAGRSVAHGCAASVLVTTGPDQGPTITG